MLPKVILHNTMSLDGSLTGFEPNLEIHYRIARSYQADVHFVGSKTAKAGIDMFMESVPPEEAADFVKPDAPADSHWWVIPDTRGILKGLLHVMRRSEYCPALVILVSKKTSREYISYLEERNYEYLVAGDDHVDYKNALEILSERYNVNTVLTDAGGTLNGILLAQGLVNEISLLVAPTVVGKAGANVFGTFDPGKNGISLELLKSESVDANYVWLVYKVVNTS
jgi:2,5-diamino-6-(ribosylamino)-4(3H)-pyrimidinone 5'-phosphate reductase